MSEIELLPGPLSIENIRVLHGANYFSAGPVVLFRLNLGAFDEVFTSRIPGFLEKLKAGVPSLEQHHCSIGKPGGFLLRVEEGTLLGHVMEHVAIELQTLAGMDVAYGKTRSTLTPGVFHVIFRFFDEEAGIYAGKAAFNLLNAILTGQEVDVDAVIQALNDIRKKNSGLALPQTYNTPIIAITGSCGKTDCVKLIGHCLQHLGKRTGIAHSGGLFIDGQQLSDEDATFSRHAQFLVRDPDLDYIVLEVSLEGILQDGLGYDFARVGIILNIGDFQNKYDDLECQKDVIYAKSVVAEEVFDDGSTILKATEELISDVTKRLYSKLILFGGDAGAELLKTHIRHGHKAVIVNNEGAVIYSGGVSAPILGLPESATTKFLSLHPDALPAAIACLSALNITGDQIRKALLSF